MRKCIYCDREHYAKNCCWRHYLKLRKYGDPLFSPCKRDIIIKNGYAEVQLNGGKKSKIDVDDISRVDKFIWSYHSCGYAVNVKTKTLLHRFILNNPKSESIDHKNHNKLDNRKQNLRICTHSKNCHNRTILNGCYYNKKNAKWISRIMIMGKIKCLGSYKSKNDAISVYIEAKNKYLNL